MNTSLDTPSRLTENALTIPIEIPASMYGIVVVEFQGDRIKTVTLTDRSSGQVIEAFNSCFGNVCRVMILPPFTTSSSEFELTLLCFNASCGGAIGSDTLPLVNLNSVTSGENPESKVFASTVLYGIAGTTPMSDTFGVTIVHQETTDRLPISPLISHEIDIPAGHHGIVSTVFRGKAVTAITITDDSNNLISVETNCAGNICPTTVLLGRAEPQKFHLELKGYDFSCGSSGEEINVLQTFGQLVSGRENQVSVTTNAYGVTEPTVYITIIVQVGIDPDTNQ